MSLIGAVKSNDTNKVRELLATDAADVYETGHNGWTPLIWASIKSHKDIIKMLLEYDGSPQHINQQTRFKLTALMHASWRGHKEIVEMLLEHDDSPEHINRQDDYGLTALMDASRGGHKEIVELLLERGASIDLLDHEGRSAIDLAKTEEIKELLLNWEPKGVIRAKGV